MTDDFVRSADGVYRLGEWWIWPDLGGRVWADVNSVSKVREWVVGQGDADPNTAPAFRTLRAAKGYALAQIATEKNRVRGS